MAGPRPVAFGSFRTDRAGRSMTRVPRTIPDYEALVDPIRCRPPHPKRQAGRCPARAAEALLRVLDADNQPVRLVLGTDALRLIEQRPEQLSGDDLAAWADLTTSTDLPTDR
ncbi:hypothetical protein [Streptomyces sp. NPDC056227]|uniref:hypothetical protein n=1 Tax=Streptomyces sp. NPDC056227 TaxID=3345753 RepID=UPI0035D83B90